MLKKLQRLKTTLSHSTVNKALTNSFWLLVEKNVNLLVGLAINIFLARYLGPEQFGVMSYLIALVALMGPISSLGLNGILSREMVNQPDSEGKILATSLMFRLCSASLTLLLLTLIFWIHPSLTNHQLGLFLILGSTQLFSCFDVLRFWFEAKVNSKHIVKYRVFVTVGMALSKLIAIYAQSSLDVIIVLIALDLILQSVILIVPYLRNSPLASTWQIDVSYGLALVRQSWWLMLSGIASFIYMKIDQVMLGAMIGNAEVGIYAVAARLSEVWYFLPTALMASFFPALLQAKANGIRCYLQRLQLCFDGLFWLAVSIAIVIYFITPWLIHTLYGKEYGASATILAIHIWAGIFVFLRAALSKWLIAESLLSFSLVTHGAGAIINIVLNLYLIPNHGGVGAAIATLISYASASWLALFLHHKTRPIGWMMLATLWAPVRYLSGPR